MIFIAHPHQPESVQSGSRFRVTCCCFFCLWDRGGEKGGAAGSRHRERNEWMVAIGFTEPTSCALNSLWHFQSCCLFGDMREMWKLFVQITVFVSGVRQRRRAPLRRSCDLYRKEIECWITESQAGKFTQEGRLGCSGQDGPTATFPHLPEYTQAKGQHSAVWLHSSRGNTENA